MRAHGLVKHVLLALVAFLLVPHGGIVEGKKREKNSKRVPSKTYSSTGASTVNGGSIKRNGVPPPPPPPPPPSGIARNRRRVKSSSSRTTSGTDGHNSNAIERSLKITPTFVQFEESPACIPVVQTVTLQHQDADSLSGKLKLYTVTSDNPQFHPAMFKQQSLSPGKSTTFQVIFLPRTTGETEATLTIKTSDGAYRVGIRGSGKPNPYGLSAFIGAKIPSGVHYNPPIRIVNSGNEILRVKEVFTTEGFLHLTLPENDDSGVKESATVSQKAGAGSRAKGSAGLWSIQAGATKEIVRLSFKSHISGRYQGYVHVKTSKENMVLPVQVTVLSGGSILYLKA